MTEKELYDMKLHYERSVANDVTVLRVPGGWVYNTWSEDNVALSGTFVPEPPMRITLQQ